MLPRHQFRETGVGCAAHHDPECLCDVVVTSPAPYYVGEHKYHKMALHELNDDTVSDRNLAEFLEIVMGLREVELSLAAVNVSVTRESWTRLPPGVSAALHNHARADSPWHIAAMELEGVELEDKHRRKVKSDYANIAGGIRAKRRKGAPKPVFKSDPEELLRRKLERDAIARKLRMEDPEYREAFLARRRAEDRKRRNPDGKGKSWLQAKRTGGAMTPGTYALEDK